MCIKNPFSDSANLKDFLRIMQAKPVNFILSIILSFGAALFDGMSIGLLVPLAQGIIGMDFSFAKNIPVFKTITYAFPQIFIYTNNPNSSIFILLLCSIFIAIILKSILGYLANLYTTYQAQRFLKNLQQFIFSRYLSFGKLFFDRSSPGHLNTILLSFSNQIADIPRYIRDIIGGFSTLAIYLTIMFIISWKLAILALTIFPALYYSVNYLIKSMRTDSVLHAESTMNKAWRFFDILSCLPVVKAYTREKEEKEHFYKLTNTTMLLEISIQKKWLLADPMQEIIITTVLLLIVSSLAFLFMKGHAYIISNFLVFFYILRRSAPLFGSFNRFKMYKAQIEGAIKNTLEILNDKDKFFIPEGNKHFAGLKNNIEFNSLNFSYIKDVPVLKDVSFSIKQGQMAAIVGPTGSGKTTLINLIMRFYDSPPSAILIDGIDIRDYTLKSLRAHIALVSQDTLLFNNSIRYNITYGIDGTIAEERLIDITKKTRLYDFVMKLPDKFDTLIGDRGVKLSGGEKQRLSVARALMKGSEILILDEATSSLDTRTERLLQEAVEEAIKGRTTIVIAHRLSTIKNADKIIVLEHGRVVEEDSLTELLATKGRFHQYWEEQKFY